MDHIRESIDRLQGCTNTNITLLRVKFRREEEEYSSISMIILLKTELVTIAKVFQNIKYFTNIIIFELNSFP